VFAVAPRAVMRRHVPSRLATTGALANQFNGGVGYTLEFGFFEKSTQRSLQIHPIHTVVSVDTFVQ